MAERRPERNAGVEANVRLACDQRVVGEARIKSGIGDDEHFCPAERVGAERYVSSRLANVETLRPEEDLLLLGYQRHCGDRNLEEVARKRDDGVEAEIDVAADQLILMQRRQALGLVRQDRRVHHESAVARFA